MDSNSQFNKRIRESNLNISTDRSGKSMNVSLKLGDLNKSNFSATSSSTKITQNIPQPNFTALKLLPSTSTPLKEPNQTAKQSAITFDMTDQSMDFLDCPDSVNNNRVNSEISDFSIGGSSTNNVAEIASSSTVGQFLKPTLSVSKSSSEKKSQSRIATPFPNKKSLSRFSLPTFKVRTKYLDYFQLLLYIPTISKNYFLRSYRLRRFFYNPVSVEKSE